VLALAEERDFAGITVRDITARAEVNRATFYLHYRDKDDLVNQALDELFEEITAADRAFADEHGRLTPDVVPPPVFGLFAHLAERRALHQRLLGGVGANLFADRLRLYEQSQFQRIWDEMGLETAAGSPPVELRAAVATGIVRSTVAWWLERADAPSAEAMAAWLWALLRPLWFDGIDDPR
jgi:AcrR family transcriptional regulator